MPRLKSLFKERRPQDLYRVLCQANRQNPPNICSLFLESETALSVHSIKTEIGDAARQRNPSKISFLPSFKKWLGAAYSTIRWLNNVWQFLIKSSDSQSGPGRPRKYHEVELSCREIIYIFLSGSSAHLSSPQPGSRQPSNVCWCS